MLVLEMKNIEKYFGDRLLFSIPDFSLYAGEKVGLVGDNGAGKTTLLRMIAGEDTDYEGGIKIYGSMAYLKQLEAEDIPGYYSGGEKTLAKIQQAFSAETHLLLADEPTSNLSMERVLRLQKQLIYFKGGLLLISHDRYLLNQVCDRVIEIDRGTAREYHGDYDFYREAKAIQEKNAWESYESYAKEKKRVEKAAENMQKKAAGMKHAPSRMGNSEARLVRGAVRQKAGKVAKNAGRLERRLERLEEVQKPVIFPRTKIDIQPGSKLHNKTAVEARDLTLWVGEADARRCLLEQGGFIIPNGAKLGLIGENGVGKTTLIKHIMDGGDGIWKAAGLKIAYFSQDLSILDGEKTIYDNVAESSAMDQTQIRNILSRMLFFREDVFKKVHRISGGEQVKVALCKIFCGDVNMLILDEPTNYLDISSMEALENMIEDYVGTVLAVSHDRSLLEKMSGLLVLQDRKIKSYDGGFAEYAAAQG